MARETDKRWKGRLIDWDEISTMDSEEYVLHALNQQQVAILLSLLEYQKWRTRWLNLAMSNAELGRYIGDIEIRLMESVTMAIDYDALKLAVQEAIYDATNDVAKQIVSGRTTNIGVDANGVVSDPSTLDPAEDLPPDDPQTGGNETLEAKAGGANAMRLGINLIWSNLNTWYVGGIALAASQARLKSLYTLNDADADILVNDYYTARQQAQPYVSSFANTLDSYFFCKGQSIQVLNRWIYENQAANLQNMSVFLSNALTQAQLDAWFLDGMETPSTDYADYSCTKTPDEVINVPIDSNVFYAGALIWKANHRLRLTVTAEGFTDPQGDIIDFWWNKSVGQPQTFKNNDTMIRVNAVEQEDASQNEVPYNAAHTYSWTMVNLNTGVMSIRVNRGAGIDVTTQGTFHVLVQDLGEIIT